jgi:hypothetical protein
MLFPSLMNLKTILREVEGIEIIIPEYLFIKFWLG